MANEEHLARLKQGVQAWNRWRHEAPTIRPYLTRADLSEADLSEANLSRANLSGANLAWANLGGADLLGANLSQAHLTRANLSRANLSGANLAWANLSRADLSQANLSRADLSEVNLSRANLGGADLSSAHLSEADLSRVDLLGANLSQANLTWANLSRANLSGANLSEAKIAWTTFGDVDLRVVQGLDTIKHTGPSTIGIDTLYRSHGNVPEIFLRGAGVPDEMITYMKSLVGRPFEFYSCFISYSSQDQEFAERLYADLQSKKVRCWFAPEDLKIGERFRTSIDEAIRLHDKLLLVLSTHSMTSAWVETEVETAFEEEHRWKKTILFPIRLDNAVIETYQGWVANIRRTRHIGDFRIWKDYDAYQQAFQRLLRDLKADI